MLHILIKIRLVCKTNSYVFINLFHKTITLRYKRKNKIQTKFNKKKIQTIVSEI